MADEHDSDDSVDRLLEGWHTPPPRPGFADRVLERVDAVEPASPPPRRRGWLLTFALGGAVGGLAVASTTSLRGGPPADGPRSLQRDTHLQAPGVADVIAEPGSEVQWRRGADGGLVVEVVAGVAWVRRSATGPGLGIVAGGDEVGLDGECGRVEVTGRLFGVDVAADVVDCERFEARAELSRRSSR